MTRTRLANNMLVSATVSAAAPAVTPVISMEDNNALNLQITVLSGGSGTMTITANIYGSDDMENWLVTGLTGSTTIVMGTSPAVAAGLVVSGQTLSFGYAYARIAFSTGGSGVTATLLAIDANTYKS